MKRLSITQLVPGMTVAEDVYDLDYELLIQKKGPSLRIN